MIEANTFEYELSVCQLQDPIIKELRIRLEKEQDSLKCGMVSSRKSKRSDKVLFLVSRAMEQDLFYKYHSDFGHFGIDKTLALLQEVLVPKDEGQGQRVHKKLYDMYCFVGQKRRFHAYYIKGKCPFRRYMLIILVL